MFKKQPVQKMVATNQGDQKLIQLIQKLIKYNGTTTNSTTIRACEKNCTIGMIKTVLSAWSILNEL